MVGSSGVIDAVLGVVVSLFIFALNAIVKRIEKLGDQANNYRDAAADLRERIARLEATISAMRQGKDAEK